MAATAVPVEDLDTFLARVSALRRDIARIGDALPQRTRLIGAVSSTTNSPSTEPAYDAVDLASSSPLGLDLTKSAATIESVAEINDTASSYTPYGPSFSGTSTSLPTVSGVYDGSSGDDTLTFRVTKGGNVGGPYTGFLGLSPASLQVEVRQSDGTLLDTVAFDESTSPDTEFALSNGLAVSFAAGSLKANDSFSLAVSSSVPTDIDPDLPMNGVRNNNPSLQPGIAVTDGSFTVNGVGISVSASDTVNDVLNRINNAATGVTALYEAATDRITMTQNTPGASPTIVFGSDSSGFLAAMKLDGAVATPGSDGDLENPVGDVAALAGIGDGSFSINGTVFSVDTASDSLADLMDRINASGAGVTASYSNDVFRLVSNQASSSVNLDDGSSGFFSALGIAPGSYAPAETGGGGSGGETEETVVTKRVLPRRSYIDGFKKLGTQLGAFFADTMSSRASPFSRGAADTLGNAIRSVVARETDASTSSLSSKAVFDTGLGFVIDLSGASSSAFILHEQDFRDALKNHATDLLNWTHSDGGNKGLLPAIDEALASVEASLRVQTRFGTGTMFNAYA